MEDGASAEARWLWGLLLPLRQDLHSLLTKTKEAENSVRGAPRVRTLNEAKVFISAPVNNLTLSTRHVT